MADLPQDRRSSHSNLRFLGVRSRPRAAALDLVLRYFSPDWVHGERITISEPSIVRAGSFHRVDLIVIRVINTAFRVKGEQGSPFGAPFGLSGHGDLLNTRAAVNVYFPTARKVREEWPWNPAEYLRY